jgi:hypothetical protein
MFHYVTANGRLQSISMIDGQLAVSGRDAWPSVSADGPMPDCHLSVGDHEIDCLAAEPAGAPAVHGISRLRIAPGERTRITT